MSDLDAHNNDASHNDADADDHADTHEAFDSAEDLVYALMDLHQDILAASQTLPVNTAQSRRLLARMAIVHTELDAREPDLVNPPPALHASLRLLLSLLTAVKAHYARYSPGRWAVTAVQAANDRLEFQRLTRRLEVAIAGIGLPIAILDRLSPNAQDDNAAMQDVLGIQRRAADLHASALRQRRDLIRQQRLEARHASSGAAAAALHGDDSDDDLDDDELDHGFDAEADLDAFVKRLNDEINFLKAETRRRAGLRSALHIEPSSVTPVYQLPTAASTSGAPSPASSGRPSVSGTDEPDNTKSSIDSDTTATRDPVLLGKGRFGSVVLSRYTKPGQSVSRSLLSRKSAAMSARSGAPDFAAINKKLETGVLVAVKRLNIPWEADFDYELARRIQKQEEAGLGSCLVHVMGIIREGAFSSLVTEYFEARSLAYQIETRSASAAASALRAPQLWSWQQRYSIVRSLAEAMLRVHDAKLIHGNLSTSNVLLERSIDRVRLADMGLAESVYRESRGREIITDINTRAPELYGLGSRTYQTRESDVFAFGMIVWQLLTAEEPFKGMADSDIERFVTSGHRPHIPGSPVVPRIWRHLIQCCWAQNPADRPPFRAIVDALVDSEDDYCQLMALTQTRTITGRVNKALSMSSVSVSSLAHVQHDPHQQQQQPSPSVQQDSASPKPNSGRKRFMFNRRGSTASLASASASASTSEGASPQPASPSASKEKRRSGSFLRWLSSPHSLSKDGKNPLAVDDAATLSATPPDSPRTSLSAAHGPQPTRRAMRSKSVDMGLFAGFMSSSSPSLAASFAVPPTEQAAGQQGGAAQGDAKPTLRRSASLKLDMQRIASNVLSKSHSARSSTVDSVEYERDTEPIATSPALSSPGIPSPIDQADGNMPENDPSAYQQAPSDLSAPTPGAEPAQSQRHSVTFQSGSGKRNSLPSIGLKLFRRNSTKRFSLTKPASNADTPTQQNQHQTAARGPLTHSALAISGTRKPVILFPSDSENSIVLCNATTGAQVGKAKVHTHLVALSHKARLIVTVPHRSITPRVWDGTNGQFLRALHGHTAPVCAVGIARTTNTVVTGSWDWTAKIWDTAAIGVPVTTLKGHVGSVYAVAISADGRTVVTGGWDQTARIWDAASGYCRRTLEGHTSWVTAVALSDNGKTLVTGSLDSTVRVWNPADGTLLYTPFTAHTGRVLAVAISADGCTAVSSGQDAVAHLWDIRRGVLLRSFRGHLGPIHAVALSPDRQLVVTGSSDGMVRVWDATSGLCMRKISGKVTGPQGLALYFS